MELLIALIPALPLAGFLFTVAVGPFLDHVPVHGHAAADHGVGDHDSAGHQPDSHEIVAVESHDTHAPVDESSFRTVPTEEEQRLTSPHFGHADDLANAEGSDGVIPPDLADGRGQTGHVVPGADLRCGFSRRRSERMRAASRRPSPSCGGVGRLCHWHRGSLGS